MNASSDPGLARRHLDPVGDHEGGIEADAELADQAGPVLGLGGGQRRAERAGAGAGDGAQVVDQLLPAHADAVVGDQQGAGVLVGHDADLRLGRRGEGRVGQRLEPAPVHRVGGVGHQLAQEDLPLGVERVHHQVEQPPDLGAKIMLFRNRIVHRAHLLAGARYATDGGGFQCGADHSVGRAEDQDCGSRSQSQEASARRDEQPVNLRHEKRGARARPGRD